MAGSGCTLCWLIPANQAALDIVYDEANSAFRDTVSVLSRPNQLSESLAADDKERLDCLRIGFDHKPIEDCLVAFGRDPSRSDIFLRETHYSRTQADLYIHPTSLDLMCRDDSSYRTTSLLFDEDCGPVGRWGALKHLLYEQAVLPSSNPVLNLCGAHFTFQWFPPSEEREIRVAKEHFLQREISEAGRRTPPPGDWFGDGKHLSTDYPEQYEYRATINPLALLNLPSDIRYLIFKLVLLQSGPITPRTSPSTRKEDTKRYHSVHGCTDLLNCSHQLLNPVYSSISLATEAADIFYSQNVFEISLHDFPSFMWTLRHMPSLEAFDPLSTISPLHLWINCDALPTIAPRHEPRWFAPQIEAAGIRESRSFVKRRYEWSDSDREELVKALAALTAQLPALRDIELHVRKEAMCWSWQETSPDSDPPLYIFEDLTPTIKEWMDRDGRDVRIFLHSQRWNWADGRWPRACDSEDVMEDITAWWHGSTDTAEDEELACKENLDWVDEIAWDCHWVGEDWKRKGVIQAAVMRPRVAEWVKKLQE